jgi:hypothetical protein
MTEDQEGKLGKFWKDLVREHPLSIILLAVLAIATAMWNLIMGYHNLVVESKNATIEANNSIVQNKNATIETQNASLDRAKITITGLEERLSAKSDQLDIKDKQLGEYRVRAMVVKANQTTYSRLSDKQLKEKALQIAQGLRSALDKYRPHERRTPSTREDWNKIIFEDERLSNELSNTYNRQYKVQAILLRDELISRLPSGRVKRDSGIDNMYEWGALIGIESAADDLEKLALSLAESNR